MSLAALYSPLRGATATDDDSDSDVEAGGGNGLRLRKARNKVDLEVVRRLPVRIDDTNSTTIGALADAQVEDDRVWCTDKMETVLSGFISIASYELLSSLFGSLPVGIRFVIYCGIGVLLALGLHAIREPYLRYLSNRHVRTWLQRVQQNETTHDFLSTNPLEPLEIKATTEVSKEQKREINNVLMQVAREAAAAIADGAASLDDAAATHSAQPNQLGVAPDPPPKRWLQSAAVTTSQSHTKDRHKAVVISRSVLNLP